MRNLAKTGGKAAVMAGAARMGGAFFNSKPGADPTKQWAQGAALMGAGTGLPDIGRGETRRGLKKIASAAVGAAVNELPDAVRAVRQRRSAAQRSNLERIYRGPSARRGDSIWAAGFSPELDQLAI